MEKFEIFADFLKRSILQQYFSVVQNTGQLDTMAPFMLPFILWGSLHLLEPITDQYKSYTFATVKQRTTRVIGRNLIEKLFSLDHRFHSNRETGNCS